MTSEEEESLVARAWTRRVLSRRPPERDPSDLVVDLTTAEGRGFCLEAEARAGELDAAFARGGAPVAQVFVCSKCGGVRSSPDGAPHAPHAGEGPPGYGPAWVDCVGDVIDPWPPVGGEPKGGVHGT